MVVIGPGRIGTGLHQLATRRGVSCTLVGRSRGPALDGPAGAPVVLAVRNEHLDEAVDQTPEHRRPDLVFVQNGALREWLAAHGLAGATRGVLFVMAARRGDDLVPGGVSPFCGPHAPAVVEWFDALGLPARAVPPDLFAEVELEKLLWLSCFGLLGDLHDAPVGVVADAHRPELAALTGELNQVGRAAWGVALAPDALVDRMAAYAASIPQYRASVKEWPFRNGWLRDRAREHGVSTPLHDDALARTGHG